MLTNSDTSKLMAKSLMLQNQGDVRVSERNRQVVAINNFLWRADQRIWRREDEQASRMLHKAIGVSTRMEDGTPEDLSHELQFRKQLLEDRSQLLPLLRFTANPYEDVRFEAFDASRGPGENGEWPVNRCFDDEVELVVFVRNQVLAEGLETDGRDGISRYCVVWLGDAIVAGARWWISPPSHHHQQTSLASVPVAVLDQLFVVHEYRGRGLAKALFDFVRTDAQYPLFVVLRNEQDDSPGRRIKEQIRDKLLLSKLYRLRGASMWVPHEGLAGNFGGGVHATVLEPVL